MSSFKSPLSTKQKVVMGSYRGAHAEAGSALRLRGQLQVAVKWQCTKEWARAEVFLIAVKNFLTRVVSRSRLIAGKTMLPLLSKKAA